MQSQPTPIRRLAVVRPRPRRRDAARLALRPGRAPGEGRFEYLKRTYD